MENREISGPHGPIPLRIYWPEASDPAKPLPVFINFHGSGFVVLGLDNYDHVCRALCQGAACIVVGVDYRKAPENKFPKPTDDAWAATLWALENCAELGGDAARIIDIPARAAGARLGDRRAMVVELQGHANHLEALLGEQRRGDGRIDAARHGDHHAGLLRRLVDAQGVGFHDAYSHFRLVVSTGRVTVSPSSASVMRI